MQDSYVCVIQILTSNPLNYMGEHNLLGCGIMQIG